jgi:hypothetical protein
MADFGQGDEVVSKPAATTTKSSWGSDDEVVSKPVEGSSGAAFGMYPKPGMQPMKAGETSSLGAFGASALESAAATPGVLAGARVGSAIAPPVAPFVGTLSKPIGGILGGVAGGMLANMGINSLEQFADNVFGTNIVGTRRQQQEESPYASLAGQVAGGAVNPFMRLTVPSTLKQAAVGGGVMSAVGAGQRAVEGADVLDPTAMAVDVATGAFTKPTKLGERLLGHTPTTKKPFVDDTIKPPEGATPEEKAKFLKDVETKKAERDSKAPLVEAAIRNKETGEIERMGPKHDQARKDATKDTHEEGFIDERGNFHERQAAVDQAKRAGQIPADHVLESPPGERPGLHSGDLRKVGDERFAVTDNKEAQLMSLEAQAEEAARVGDEARVTSINEQIKALKQSQVKKPAQTSEQFILQQKKDFYDSVDKLTKQKGETYEKFNAAYDAWDSKRIAHQEIGTAKSKQQELKAKKDLDEASAKIKQVESELQQYVPQEGDLPAEIIYKPKEQWTPEDHETYNKYMDSLNKRLEFLEEKQAFETTQEAIETHKIASKTVEEMAAKTSGPVAEEFKKLDPRSMPNEEAMMNHATDIYERYGEADAIKFFEDYKQNLNERSIPVPNNNQQLDDMLHKLGTYTTKDRSEHVVGYKENTDKGVTEQQRAQWFNMRENGVELPPEGKAVLDAIDAENIALVRKAKGMGLEVGEEFTSGQSRIRLFSEKEKPGWKESIKKFFSNDTPMGDKIANEADAAIERKVFQTDDGRVIELHRQPEDTQIKMPDGKMRQIKKGTEIWEWKDGKKQLIGHSDNLQLKRGDKFDTKRFSEKLSEGPEVGTASERRKFKMEPTIVDGKVPEIERHSPYRYLHDAEASARIANMGLRKMVREAEAIENLKKSELFKQVGHSPEQDLKDLPKGWKQPENIDRIPQLRGWAFDPKTRVIIEDFAKVWDNSMYMKLSNAIVKNMMLNPIPHMFNEVMHLWNARGFSGWVMPSRLGTFADTARVAWRDVGNQTQFYRDIMREGGSVLGADPRNKGYFDVIQKEASKQMFGTPEMERNMKGLAKKLGVPVANLYNGISEASQKAMWFTRDVMYVQLVREIMARQEKSGNKMTLKEAIDQAEKHMPNYRLPSEVAGSRAVSYVLRDPRISMFSRYHYGMVKSLVNTLKDVDPRNLKTAEGREHFREGVDSMIAIGVALSVLYPLMDSIAEVMFGEGAEQRRAGPFHLLHAGMDVVTGKKDASALIWPVFTFNPVALTVGQLAFNKKIFTGKEIYHPDDSLADIMGDVTGYTAGQIPQVPPIMSATSEEEGATKLLARQLDIKAKTPEQLAREERAKARQERVKKGRDTKREKGTYKP